MSKKQQAKKVTDYMYDVIRSPIVTEKSNIAISENKVVFNVANTASKPLIKQSIEALFGVEVLKVNVINVKGKAKVFRGVKGQRKDKKKAIVTINKDQSIDFMSKL